MDLSDNPLGQPLRLIGISAGKVEPLFVKDGEQSNSRVMSAIRKSAVSTLDQPDLIRILRMGIEGDEQANPSVHGGLDKAVYMMPKQHYAFWEQQRATHLNTRETLADGFLGENLTVEGLDEKTVFVGDRITIGEVVLSVTDPREPCFKFNARMGYKHASKHMVQAGCCGWYLRVLNEGSIHAGQTMIIEAGPRRISIAEQFARLNRRFQKDLFEED